MLAHQCQNANHKSSSYINAPSLFDLNNSPLFFRLTLTTVLPFFSNTLLLSLISSASSNLLLILATTTLSSSRNRICRFASLLGRILISERGESPSRRSMAYEDVVVVESELLSLLGGEDSTISISKIWMCKSRRPSARLCERARKCGQWLGVQKESVRMAVRTAGRMGWKLGVGEEVMAWEYPEDMAAAMTARMVVSEERMLVVEQVGHPIDVHQSSSSVNMHWSQTYASRASPRNANSSSHPA